MTALSKKPRVLVLAHSAQGGGAELALASLIESTLDMFEWSVVFASDSQPASALVKNLRSYTVLDLPWWCYEAHDKPMRIDERRLKSNLKELQYLAEQSDVLLTNTITIPWLGFVAQSIDKPHIWYVHEFGDIDHNLKFILGYRQSLELIANSSTVVLAISSAIREHLSRVIPSEKIMMIHQAIDLQNLLKIPLRRSLSRPLKLLCAGAMKPSKGQLIAAKATALLGPDQATIRIAGPSANQKYVEQLLRLKSTAVQVDVGFTDLKKEYSDADVITMCSDNEALGRITLEAIAAGRIVIGYDCPSTNELLSHGRGVLYKPNTARALSETIESLINGKITKPNLQEARQYVAEAYSMETQASDFSACVIQATTKHTTYVRSTLYLSEYLQTLQSLGLFATNSSRFRERSRKHISHFVPAFVKKFVRSF